jgi:hypothetical protein
MSAPEHRRRQMPGWLPAVLAVAAIVGAGVWFTVGNVQESDRADQNAAVATDQATTLDRLCATDADVARRIPEDCAEAREVRENVVLPATTPGPSQAQVQGWVTDWLERNPPQDGRDVTPEMVARAVAEHMEGNGQARIAQVAQAYLASNAELFRGEDGQDGEAGQDATDDQVAAAVAAFCAERDSCSGPQGPRGDQGVQGQGVADIRPERNGEGVCEWIVVFVDPASGESREVRHPAGDAACPAAEPPPGELPESPGESSGLGGLLPG